MWELIKYCGFALAFVAAWSISSGYDSFAKRRLSEYEAYLKLITHIEWALSVKGATVREWCEGYSDPVLDALELLPLLRSGTPIKEAYQRSQKRSCASAEAKELLGELFSEYGNGYLSRELMKLKHTKEALTKISECEAAVLTKNARLYRMLLFTGALGIVILAL